MRAVVTGAGGLLGGALCRLAPAGVEVTGVVRTTPAPAGVAEARIDLTSLRASAALARLAPDVVLHCAYGLNRADIVDATVAVAAACRETGAALIALSTDALFDGEHGPYRESDDPSPITDYGRWKAEAERLVEAGCPDAAIVRTSLLVHTDPTDHGARRLLDLAAKGERITLFVDEWRCPIMVADLAAALWEIAALAAAERRGRWHVAGPERMSRAELGDLMVRHHGIDPSLVDHAPQSTMPGRRPRDVALSCERALSTLTTRPRPVDAAALADPWGGRSLR